MQQILVKEEHRLEMTFVNVYGLRNNIMRTVRMSSFDRVMQLPVCKNFLNLLNFGGWEDEKSFREFISHFKIHSSKNETCQYCANVIKKMLKKSL